MVIATMRWARCLRDTVSVKQRERFCPSFLCDVCNEYEETWDAYKQEFGNKDSTEFARLYDKLSELREKIDQLANEATHSQKKGASR